MFGRTVTLSASALRQATRRPFGALGVRRFAAAAAPVSGQKLKKVLIPTSLDTAAAEILSNADFEVIQDADAGVDLLKQHPDAYGVIVRSEKITKDVLDGMTDLKVLVRAGAGYNTIDTKHARRCGVDVMNTPGANANAVAEEVVAMALACYRHVVPGDASTRAGKWEKKKFMGRELYGRTVGILGLGNIGQLVAERLRGFDCNILGYDPVISPKRAKDLGIALASVEEIFANSDIISLHVPENDDTRGMVNSDLLKKTKEGAVIINCARSGVVDEDAVRAAKETKELYLCTDVYPADEAGDKPVADIASIMLPHVGANTKEANSNAARRAANQIVEFAHKGVSKYVVNRAIPEGLDERHQLLSFYCAKIAHKWLGSQNPERLSTVFYGDLHQYGKWLTGPAVLGMQDIYDPLFDSTDATKYLAKRGIEHVDLVPKDRKGYGESVTIDLVEGTASTSNKASIRGTLSEGTPFISRLDGYEKLFFDPRGKSILVEYVDRPGVIASISAVLRDSNINILDIRAPQDHVKGTSLAILKTDKDVPASIMKLIKSEADAQRAIFVNITATSDA